MRVDLTVEELDTLATLLAINLGKMKEKTVWNPNWNKWETKEIGVKDEQVEEYVFRKNLLAKLNSIK